MTVVVVVVVVVRWRGEVGERVGCMSMNVGAGADVRSAGPGARGRRATPAMQCEAKGIPHESLPSISLWLPRSRNPVFIHLIAGAIRVCDSISMVWEDAGQVPSLQRRVKLSSATLE